MLVHAPHLLHAGTFSGTFTNPGTSDAQITFTAHRPLPAPTVCKIAVPSWTNSGLHTPLSAQVKSLASRTVSIIRADGTVAVAAQPIGSSPWVGDAIVVLACSQYCSYSSSTCENTMNGASGSWLGGHDSLNLDHTSYCNGGLSETQRTLWLQYDFQSLSYNAAAIAVDWQDPCYIASVAFTFSDGSTQTFPAVDGCVPDAPATFFQLAAVTTTSVNMTFTLAASATTWDHARVNSFMAYGAYIPPSAPALVQSILELSSTSLNTSVTLE